MVTGEDKDAAQGAAPEGAAPDINAPSEGAGPAGAETAAAGGDPLEALRGEMEETRSQMLRALAEAENVRRRAQRDVADARQYAVTAFARDLLNVADNFQRALSVIDESAELAPELQSLVDGVRMTERELNAVFERHGVTVVNPVGERFDPNRHQAMFEIENPDVPSGTVLQVMQAGAVIGERTLRPAMVGVSKGGPKPGEAGKSQEAAGEGNGETA